MPADTLSREEIERLQSRLRSEGVCMTCVLRAPEPYGCSDCLNTGYERGEVARLASARQEGYREGVEAAARWHADQAAAIDEHIAKRGQVEFVSGLGRVACFHRQFATDMLAALSPAPAEPSDEEWLRGLIAWCRPGVVRDALDRYLAEGTAVPDMTPIVQSAEPSAPVAPDWPTRCAALEADGIAARKRVAALEAENAKLRERNEKLVEGLRPFAEDDVWHASIPDEFRALNPRYTVGDLRRARALLQGCPDAG